MKVKILILVLSLLLAFVFTACDSVKQTVEVTRLVPQTVEVTEIVTQVVAAPQIIQATATELSEPVSSIPQGPLPDLDTAYYDGIITITQYYTFLGQGLYEEAYLLLSSSAQAYPLQDYIKYQKDSFKIVKIISIRPFNLRANPLRSTPDPKNRKWFSVTIYAEGEEGWSGSVPNGEQSFYVAIIQESGIWKIDKWATGIAP